MPSSSISRSSSVNDLSSLQGISVELSRVDPANLEFEHNNKTYTITFVKQKIGGEKGEEKSLDLKNVDDKQKLALIIEAQKAMAIMEQLQGPDALKNSKSFTFHFTTQIKEPSFLNKVLGQRIKRFEYKPNPYELDSITYKEGSEDKKFAVNLSKYEEQAQQTIQSGLQPLNTMIKELFKESAQAEKPLKLGQHKAETPIPKNQNDSDVSDTDSQRAENEDSDDNFGLLESTLHNSDSE